MAPIPSRRELLGKILRKLASPRDLRKFIEFKTVSGDEYPYFDLVDQLPWVGSLLAKIGGGKLDIDAPVFVAGLRRSGTTLFYRVMNANSALFLFNERFPGDRMNGRGVPSENNIYYSVEDPADFRRMVISYLSPRLKRRYPRWGAKLALELAHPDPGSVSISGLERILAAFPRAKIIGVTRDPRDFVLSALKRGGHDVQWWVDEYKAMMDVFGRLAEKDATTIEIVKYEDLVENPNQVVRRCCGFAGLPFEESMLDPAQWSVKGPKEYESSRISGRHGKWRAATGNDKEVVDFVNDACFPAAARFGYEPV